MQVDQSRLDRRLRRLGRVLVRSLGRMLPVLALLVFLFAGGADAQIRQRPKLDEPGSFEPGQIIIGLKPGTTDAAMRTAVDGAKLEIMRRMRLPGYYLLRVKTADGKAANDLATLDAAKAMRDTNLFKFARPNYRMWKLDTTPNDPLYKNQWHYPLINMPQSWDLTKSSSNVIVASLDTGVDVDHPEFKDHIYGKVNFTVQPNDQDVHDADGHGTHTSGTMTAATNNNVGVASVTFGSSPLFVGKVLGDQGFGSWADFTDALMYVADNVKTPTNNVVLNMSLGADVGSDDPDLTFPPEAACMYAASKQCVLVISAGNSYIFGNPPSTPARVAQLDPRIFCVGACGAQKEHADYSTARRYTTISAPGGNGSANVWSTLPVAQGSYGDKTPQGDPYQGTSMAAPHVSGVAALLLGLDIAPDQLKTIITSTADTGGRQVPNADFGYGVIDAYAAIVLAKSAITLVNPKDGSYVYGNFGITLKAGDPTKYLKAELQVDSDPTVVDTAAKGDFTLNWNTVATDPSTGAPMWPNGAHKITVTVTTPSGPVKFARNVRVDNPIAAITTPAPNGYVTKTVDIAGTADGLRIPTYNLEYALATAPTTWVSIVANQNTKIGGGTLGSWTLGNLPDGAATVRLRVANPDGYEVSTTVPVTIDQTTPSIPTNLTGVGSHQTATLSWAGSSDPNPGKLAGYNIYRSRQSLTGYQKINTAILPSTTYVDQGLTNAFTYFYRVTAVDAAGNESAPTDIKDVTPNRNGTVAGQVISLDGTFLEAADVTVLQNGATVANGSIKTDTAGQFAYPGPPGFPTGTYDIKAAKTGYVAQLIKGVSVEVGRDATAQNFALQAQPTFPSGWTMFTLPYDFGGADLGSVFTGGTVKYYDATLGRYLDPTDPAFPKPRPGIGYWLNKSGTPVVTGAGVPNKPVTPVAIPIRKGWNLLGNPFQDPIHWILGDLVVTRGDNGQQATLNLAANLGWALDFAWGGTDGRSLIFDRGVIPGVVDTIPGYGAFWFRSEVDGTLSIAPPSIVNRSAKESKGQWTIQLNASAGDRSASAYVGVGSTHRVVPMPPQVSAGVRLLLGENATYAADLRDSLGATQTWDVTVDQADNKSVTLTWPGSAMIPRQWNIALVDKSTGQRVNLRTSSSLTLPATRAAHKLQVELSRESGVNRILITDLVVNANRGTAPAISFNLAREGRTTISILKSNGDTVRTLASRSVKAGQNSMVWDTKDDQGRSVAPGVYLVQVRAVGDKGDQAKAILPVVITR